MSPVNVCIRVAVHTGWFSKIRGKRSTHAAIVREVESLNKQGYRVVCIHPDEWGFFRKVLGFLVAFFTLGFFGSQPGVLVVGEALDANLRGMEMAMNQP